MRRLSLLMLLALDACSEEPALGMESSRREIAMTGNEILIDAGSAYRDLEEIRESVKRD